METVGLWLVFEAWIDHHLDRSEIQNTIVTYQDTPTVIINLGFMRL